MSSTSSRGGISARLGPSGVIEVMGDRRRERGGIWTYLRRGGLKTDCVSLLSLWSLSRLLSLSKLWSLLSVVRLGLTIQISPKESFGHSSDIRYHTLDIIDHISEIISHASPLHIYSIIRLIRHPPQKESSSESNLQPV